VKNTFALCSFLIRYNPRSIHLHQFLTNMSTSPSSRGSARSTSQRPSTPDQTRPSMARASSLSVAPKSEALRNALQARRAQHSTTPTPREMRSAPPAPLAAADPPEPSTSPDGFAEFELSEEQIRPVSPIRRRRPSHGGVPLPKTNRQLTEEIEALKNKLMDTNMRVQLLKKNNSELQHDNTRLKERVEELEPLDEENNELHDENNHLKLKIQDMEDEMERLRDDNDKLQKSQNEMITISMECSSQWEDQVSAIQEAADAIIALEKEKAALADEVHILKERVSNLEYDSIRTNALVDGSPRCPSRVYSIDESRPSTSHFDSDYYSQSESPMVKASKESVLSIAPSERSRKLIDLTQERRRSARDLAKRMSTASSQNLRAGSAPEVPQIPIKFQQDMPQVVEHVVPDERSSRAPKRYRERRLPDHILQEALQISPRMPESPASSSPVLQVEEPRRAHRSNQLNKTRSSSLSRPSSSHNKTPTTATRPRHHTPSGHDVSPRVPSRRSSKQAHTNSSSEYLSHHELHQPRQRRSEPDIVSTEVTRTRSEEWASMPPPPAPARFSIVSQSSLTSDSDPQDKDRWWKSIQPLTQQQQQQMVPQLQLHGARPSDTFLHSQPLPSPTLSRSKSHRPDVSGHHTKLDNSGSGSEMQTPTFRIDTRKTRTQPSTPRVTTPYMEQDFLFNAAEDADTFMRKAKAKLSGRK
jgi:hypothetical protein